MNLVFYFVTSWFRVLSGENFVQLIAIIVYDTASLSIAYLKVLFERRMLKDKNSDFWWRQTGMILLLKSRGEHFNPIHLSG